MILSWTEIPVWGCTMEEKNGGNLAAVRIPLYLSWTVDVRSKNQKGSERIRPPSTVPSVHTQSGLVAMRRKMVSKEEKRDCQILFETTCFLHQRCCMAKCNLKMAMAMAHVRGKCRSSVSQKVHYHKPFNNISWKATFNCPISHLLVKKIINSKRIPVPFVSSYRIW